MAFAIGLFLETCTVKDLKKSILKLDTCTAKSHFSGKLARAKKADLIFEMKKLFYIIKFQRRFRKKQALNKQCPVSLETLRYPFWSVKTPSGRIYYNLQDIAEYYVTSGDFRDPWTRNKLTMKDIYLLDSLVEDNKIKITNTKFKSNNNIISKAYNNSAFYKQEKDNSEQIDILSERIRHIFCTIREKLESMDINGLMRPTLMVSKMENIYFPNCEQFIDILNNKCRDTLVRTLYIVQKIMNDTKCYSDVSNNCKNIATTWLYNQIKKLKISVTDLVC